jgi:hypothetical protein
MKASPPAASIFALPADVQREAMVLGGYPIPVSAADRATPAGTPWQSVQRSLIALGLMLSAAYCGHLFTKATYDIELSNSVDRAEQAEAQVARLTQQALVVQPEPQPSPTLPPLESIASDAPVPTTAPVVAAASVQPAGNEVVAESKTEAPKVAMVSIPAGELQAAIRRARAAGPKPASKPTSIEKAADKPAQVTAANWQALPIEFIPADRSMIATVAASGITLKNGGAIAIGGMLSGTERVLAVDPPNTIITSRRILSITRN